VYNFEEEYEKPTKKTYKDFIIKSTKTLSVCEQNIFTSALNLVISGELNEVNKVFEINDTYNLNMNHLTTSEDVNVQKITNVIDCINQAIQTLKNLNNIKDEEID